MQQKKGIGEKELERRKDWGARERISQKRYKWEGIAIKREKRRIEEKKERITEPGFVGLEVVLSYLNSIYFHSLKIRVKKRRL